MDRARAFGSDQQRRHRKASGRAQGRDQRQAVLAPIKVIIGEDRVAAAQPPARRRYRPRIPAGAPALPAAPLVAATMRASLSTTSTRRLRKAGAACAASPAGAACGAARCAGSSRLNRLPRPGREATSTRPPSSRAMRSTSARPSPSPSTSTCPSRVNSPKIAAILSVCDADAGIDHVDPQHLAAPAHADHDAPAFAYSAPRWTGNSA
jgi:hypothetical protein